MASDSGGIDWTEIPSGIPPPGVTPNFANPESNAYITRDVMYGFLPLMIVFLVLRIYARIHTGFKFGPDDFLSIAAAGSITAFCGVLLSLLDNPLGHHQYDIPVSDITDDFLRKNLVFVVLFATSAMLVKCSLLVLYLRIFRPIVTVNWIIYLCIGVISAFYISTLTAYSVLCSPRPGFSWVVSQVVCGTAALNIAVVQGVFGPVSDLVVMLIPMTLVLPLSLPPKKKVAVAGIFLTGSLALACSIVNCVLRFKERTSVDYTWEGTYPGSMAIIELTIGHICCSLPTFPPLFMAIRKLKWAQSAAEGFKNYSCSTDKGSEIAVPIPSAQGPRPEVPAAIPSGRLTGLRSFVQRVRGLEPRPASRVANGSNQEESRNELNSVDMDYHAQLRTTAGV
ncbi:hypothetical protein GQ53DRAFT_740474 [Thozetella sp. PMI_491]|nr:hypothetical protein GQ53DRAFT_740474 [Thozetella sp. PMI_491]